MSTFCSVQPRILIISTSGMMEIIWNCQKVRLSSTVLFELIFLQITFHYSKIELHLGSQQGGHYRARKQARLCHFSIHGWRWVETCDLQKWPKSQTWRSNMDFEKGWTFWWMDLPWRQKKNLPWCQVQKPQNLLKSLYFVFVIRLKFDGLKCSKKFSLM